MAKYLKPQTPLQHYNGDYIYPITSADQVLVSNGERLNANLINIDLNNSNIIPENILKPQNPMIKGSDYFYPLTTSDQVIMPDGTRLDDNVGGTKMELLWENASPNSDFAAQTLTIPIDSEYRYIMWFKFKTTASDYFALELIPNVRNFCTKHTLNWAAERMITLNNNAVEITDQYASQFGTGTSQTFNNEFVPYKLFRTK